MGGAYLHSPNTPSWRGAQLRGAQGQVYLLRLLITTSVGLRIYLQTEARKRNLVRRVLRCLNAKPLTETPHSTDCVLETKHCANTSTLFYIKQRNFALVLSWFNKMSHCLKNTQSPSLDPNSHSAGQEIPRHWSLF
jgi:hypothetical protein